MATPVQEVRETTTQSGDTVQTVKQVRDPAYATNHRQNVAARVIWFIAGILIALLIIRFVFALLGANPNNGFANFIYSVTHPFVAPFFSLFNYNFTAGVSRFESYTLVAIVVYLLIAYGLGRLVTLNRRRV